MSVLLHRRLLVMIVLIVASALVTYEWHLRAQWRDELDGAREPMVLHNRLPLPNVSESSGGGPFPPHVILESAWIDGGTLLSQSMARTNNLGFLSDDDYHPSRDPHHPEYRIVVLGSTMTGNPYIDQQWVDLLEDRLNGDEALAQAMDGKSFRLYNLGRPERGFADFLNSYRRYGPALDPDMILVNFSEADFAYTGSTQSSPPARDEEEMIRHAIEPVQMLLALGKPVLFTVMPRFHDLSHQIARFPRTRRLMEQVPAAQVMFLQDGLFWPGKRLRIKRWYQPSNGNYLSTLGNHHFSQAMAPLIAWKVAGIPPIYSCDQEMVMLTPAVRSRNQVRNGDFSRGFEKASFTVTTQNVEVAPDWWVLSDGGGGQGTSQVERLALAPEKSPLPMHYLRFKQTVGATAGSPSLSQSIGRFADMPDSDALLSFQARAPEETHFTVMVVVHYGTGGAPSNDEVIFAQTVLLTSNWQTFNHILRLPALHERSLGSNDNDQVRLILVPQQSASPFTMDLTDVLFSPDRLANPGERAVTLAGHRIPLRELMKLRASIDERFHDGPGSGSIAASFRRWFGSAPMNGGTTLDLAAHEGFVPFAMEGTAAPLTVHLRVRCTRPPVALDNPACRHHYQLVLQ